MKEETKRVNAFGIQSVRQSGNVANFNIVLFPNSQIVLPNYLGQGEGHASVVDIDVCDVDCLPKFGLDVV